MGSVGAGLGSSKSTGYGVFRARVKERRCVSYEELSEEYRRGRYGELIDVLVG